jgi:hypothetical protein
VLVALDAVAIGGIGDVHDTFLPALRRHIARAHGIPASHLMVHATHTHPSGRLLCPPRLLLKRVCGAVGEAMQSRTEITLGAGCGCDRRLMMNRSLLLKDGRKWTVRQAYPCPPDGELAGMGPTDPAIGILRIDRLDGRPLAVVFNFAGHPLLGVPDGAVTANYPGFAATTIEEQLGPGMLALFLQGAGGDVTEVLYKDVQRPRDARPVGIQLGLRTLKAWREIRTGPATLAAASRSVRLPRRRDVPRRLAALHKRQERLLASLRFTSLNFRSFLPLYLKYALNPDFPADYAFRYRQEEALGVGDLRALDVENRRHLDKYLANLGAMEELAKIQDDLATLRLHAAANRASGQADIRIDVQGFRIGDAVVLASPAELLAEVGLRMKQASPFAHTLIASCSNGYLHYGAAAGDYDRGGYEVMECLLGAGWQKIHEAATRALFRELAAEHP